MLEDFPKYIELQDAIKKLEEENKILKEQLTTKSHELMSSGNLEENIAQIQLALLNSVSMTRELTLEEAKKCEIYSKILNNAKKSVKDVDAEVRNLDTNKLLESLG